MQDIMLRKMKRLFEAADRKDERGTTMSKNASLGAILRP